YSDLSASLAQREKDASAVEKSRRVVENALSKNEAFYGINTGFGALASKRIGDDQLRQLQRNLILSHAVGTGNLIPKDISRLMLQLKIHALGIGNSGISRETFERLQYFARQDLIPVIPEKGSVGASGDLAPLAHMSLPLMGYGSFWDASGNRPVPAGEVLKMHNLQPIDLQPK